MATCIGILSLLSIFALSNAFFFPAHKVLTYDYHATISANSNEIPDAKSKFELFAKINVRGYDNVKLIFQIKNVTYSTNSGDDSKEIPFEAQAILLPFYMEHENEMGFHSIKVNHKDVRWSMNMKRSIAALFIVKENIIKDKTFIGNETKTQEDLHLGICDVYYKSLPSEEGRISFLKEFGKCTSSVWYMHASTLHRHDDCSKYKDPMPKYQIIKNYDLAKYMDEFYIDSVKSHNVISFTDNKDTFLTNVDHNLKLNKMEHLPETDIPSNEYRFASISVDAQYETEGIYDLTGGRRNRNVTSIESKVKTNMLALLKGMDKTEIDPSNVDKDDYENMTELIEQMKYLDEESLYKILKAMPWPLFNEDRIYVYMKVLAITGTTQSLLALQKMIKMDYPTDDISGKALLEIPFNIKAPKQLFFDQLMDFVKDRDSYYKHVREPAILALSGLIKTESLSFSRERVDVSSYIEYFIKEFENSIGSENELLHLSALINIQVADVAKYLESVAKNEHPKLKFTPHIRSLAMIGIMQYIKNDRYFHPWMLRSWIMDMFFDVTEDHEVRSTALRFALYYGSDEQFLKLFWHMNKETDEVFLRMFHTTVQSYSSTVSVCHQSKLKEIKNLHEFIRKPKLNTVGDSFVKIFDYFDELHGFGSMIKASAYGKKILNIVDTLYLEYTWNFAGYNFDQYAVYIYAKTNHSTIKEVKSKSDILKLNETDLSIEIIVFRNDLIIQVLKTTPREIFEKFSSMEKLFDHYKTYNFYQQLGFELTLSSDLGLPVSIFLKKPNALITQASSLKGKVYSYNSFFQLSKWSRGKYGVKVYNPIADLWHGVQRVQTEDLRLFAIVQHSESKFSWQFMNEDITELPLEFKSAVHTEKFTDDGESEPFTTISYKDPALEEYVFWSIDDEHTGLTYNFKIYDCEPRNLIDVKNQLKQRFLSVRGKNSGSFIFANFYLTFQKVWDYVSVLPVIGSCGVLLKVEKSKKHAVKYYTGEFTKSIESERHKLIIKAVKTVYPDVHQNEFHLNYNKQIDADGNFSMFLEFENMISLKNSSLSNPMLRVHAVRHFWGDEVHSNFSVMSGVKHNGETKIDNELEIKISKKPSYVQNKNKDREVELYKTCSKDSYINMNECMRLLTHLRYYKYHITYKGVDSTKNTMLYYLDNFLRGSYPEIFNHISAKDVMSAGNLNLSLNYPIDQENAVDLSLDSEHESYIFKNISLDNFIFEQWSGPHSAFDLSYFGFKSFCEFSVHNLKNENEINIKNFVLTTEWMRMFSDCKNDTCSWKIEAKRIDDTSNSIALNIKVNDKVVDVLIDKEVEILVNDETIDISKDSRYYFTTWIDVKVFKDDHRVLIHLKNDQVNIDFNGTSVKILMPWIKGDGICHSFE